MPDVFAAIADPTRRAVLDLLAAQGPRIAGDIAAEFPALSQPAISRHLKVLRDSGLVTVTVNAQQRIYTLDPEGLMQLYEWVAKYQAAWPKTLDSLGRYLDVASGQRAFDRQVSLAVGATLTVVDDFRLPTALPGYIIGVSCASTLSTTSYQWEIDGVPIFPAPLDHVLTPVVATLYPLHIPFGRSGNIVRIRMLAMDAAAPTVTMRFSGYQVGGGELRGLRPY